MSINYLGSGMSNPVVLVNGKPLIRTGVDLINESIADILSTPIGSKLFLPEYGSRLQELLFEPNDEVVTSMLHLFIIESIKKWEKRINLAEVNFNVDGALVECFIKYTVLNKSDVETFIYPFYRKLNY